MKFQEISDKQWESIQKHLPKPARTGRPRCDDRTTINGIMFVLVTGCRWDEMPTLSTRISDAEFRTITEFANACGPSVSDLIKKVLINKACYLWIFPADKYFDESYCVEPENDLVL